ncbi:uncharacterized protein LOC128983107 [Macrosteles quadrilineatus]|uniref:uncharacterized protein LOC128983107 n=1 Tax=Macrosteles quadrilineatus TaxID=74068 RepID=UPI0023E1A7FB|nr:uncharacterized protein LOC128983107 [Macrosteles quadrilineatus]
MQPGTLLCCLAFVVFVATCEGMELRPRTTSTPLPPRRERLPYTPVRNSTRKERLPYTPVKPTTQRPGILNRVTTKRIPFPKATSPKPCPCQCNTTNYRPVCAVDGSEKDTFPNQCQLDCHNCTMNKRFKVIAQGECSR